MLVGELAFDPSSYSLRHFNFICVILCVCVCVGADLGGILNFGTN